MKPTRRAALGGLLRGLLGVPLLLALPSEGEARVGGGHSFDGGGGSSGGSGGGSSGGYSGGSSGGSSGGGSSFGSSFGSSRSSGGGGGGGAEGAEALIFIFFGLAMLANLAFQSVRSSSYELHGPSELLPPLPGDAPHGGPPRRRPAEVLREVDPNFSETLFLDFVHLLYVRAHELRGQGKLDALSPYIPAKLRAALRGPSATLDDVSGVVVGSSRIKEVALGPLWTTVTVALECNFSETCDGVRRRFITQETWTFRRKPGVTSPGPERMRALVCAACGSSASPRADGACPSCDTPRGGGASQWELGRLSWQRKELPPLQLSVGHAEEAGTHAPTRVAPDLAAGLRALSAGDPDFAPVEFKIRVIQVFRALQEAWAALDWEPTRPLQTDKLFRANQLWIDLYRERRLVNHIEDIRVQKVELVRAEVDAWVEAVTVRVHASMRDWTATASGEVVSGDAREPRAFTEYWTFARTAAAERRPWDPKACPACGAPADKVNQSGICGYCDAHITSGDFNWVLSRIEQDEVYRG